MDGLLNNGHGRPPRRISHCIYLAGTCVLGVASVSPNVAVAQDFNGDLRINPDTRIVFWESKNGNTGAETSSGWQVYTPVGGKLATSNDQLNFDLLVRSGYVWTSHRQTDGDGASVTGEVQTPTDTSVTGTATLLSIAGVQPYVSLGFNIPTGKTELSRVQRVAIVDSDIVQVPSYGQGLNVGPTIGANIPLNPDVMLSASVGHTLRGEFDRYQAVGPVERLARVDPSDVTTVSGSLAYSSNPVWLGLTASYSHENETIADGAPFFRSGDSFYVGGYAGYSLDQNWSLQITASYAQSQRNFVFEEIDTAAGVIGGLFKEPLNSNSSVTTILFEPTYTVGSWTLTPSLNFVYRDNNSYNPATFEFLPAKTSLSVAGTAQYAVSDKISIISRIEHFWLDERASPDKLDDLGIARPGTGTPPVESSVWLLTFGGTISF